MDLSEKTDNLKELNNKVLSQAQEINLLETKLDTLNSQFENNTDGNEKLMKTWNCYKTRYRHKKLLLMSYTMNKRPLKMSTRQRLKI